MRTFAVEYAQSVRSIDRGLGTVKLWELYQQTFRHEEYLLGRDAFINLMDENGLKLRLRYKKPRTTDSSHGLPVYPNKVKDFIPTTPNQLWVSDITYIILWHENSYDFCYLSLIMDAYTKEIIGWYVGDSLKTENSLIALRMALKRLKDTDQRPIHHSDRGCQYASLEYTNLLKEYGIEISMTESGDPKDNAQAERINNTIKNEFFKDIRFHSIEDVRRSVVKAVDFYNNCRPHMSINMMTPSQAAQCTGEIDKRWISYREKAIKEKSQQDKLLIPENCLSLQNHQGSPLGLRPQVNP